MRFVGDVHVGAGRAGDIPRVLSLLRAEGIETENNPDISVQVYHQFGIDDARELGARAAAKALHGRRVFLIVADSMSSEAQNALLKTLEEPRGGALFIFIVPSPMQILPTVRSRAQIFELPELEITSTSARAFIRATPAARLEMLKPLLEKGDDDTRDFGAILSFLSALEHVLEKSESRENNEGLRALYRTRKFLGDRGALIKPLLEQMALLIP